MSWAGDLTSPDWSVAAMLGTVRLDCIPRLLSHSGTALLGRQGEGWTVVVDAAKLRDIRIIEQFPSSLCRAVNGQLTPVIKGVSRLLADLLRRCSGGVSGQTVQIS